MLNNLNLQKYSKHIIIFIIVFIILKVPVGISIYESILLSSIVAVSLLIIENLLLIDIVSDEDCNKCNINKNINNVVNVENIEKKEIKENFIDDVLSVAKSVLDNKVNSENKENNENNIKPQQLKDTDDYEYKCVRVKRKETFENLNNIEDELNKPINLENLENLENIENIENIENNENIENMNNINVEQENNENNKAELDNDYLKFQIDGRQQKEIEKAKEINMIRREMGNKDLVNEYEENAKKHYNNILSRSSNSLTADEAKDSELKYSDYNYIAPLNKGMTDRKHTFVSPNNWYPIPPYPPVCVTNKRCATTPIVISNLNKDSMNFADLDDFNTSRRFTGNMNINIDYVKNVLNNDTSE
jgi:hypothetical protein